MFAVAAAVVAVYVSLFFSFRSICKINLLAFCGEVCCVYALSRHVSVIIIQYACIRDDVKLQEIKRKRKPNVLCSSEEQSDNDDDTFGVCDKCFTVLF